MEEVLIVMTVMAVPISAIISHTVLKSRKIASQVDSKLGKLVDELHSQNTNLNERVENLETIVTSVDWERLQMKSTSDADEVRKLAEELETIRSR